MEAENRGVTASWKGDVAFAAAVALLSAVLVLRVFPSLLDGFLVDTDSYMRLVRVRQLAETGNWYDGGMIARSNAPFGSSLHWTRPLDVLILVGAWILAPLLGFDRALHLSGLAVSPILLIAVCFATAWAARPLAGSSVRYYTMIAVLAQVALIGYALPGRPDHHLLILLAFVAMYGSALRLGALVTWPRAAWATGAWAAFGLWVSLEFLVPVFVLLLVLVVMWVVKGSEWGLRGRVVSLALLVGTAVAVLFEHPPRELLLPEFDHISIVHLLVVGTVAGFWVGAATRRLSDSRRPARGIYAVVGAFTATAVVLALYPRFFGGPMVDVDPELKRSWLPLLTEYQPYLVPRRMSDVGRIIAYLGHALLASGVVIHGLIRRRQTRVLWEWLMLGTGLAVFIPLGIRTVRFAPYAELLGVLGTMVLLAGSVRWMAARSTGMALSIRRASATAGILAGPILLGAALMALGGEAGDRVQEAGAAQVDACPAAALLSELNDPVGLGDRPRILLAQVDLGPLLLYRTSHSVVATPYHRNADGILDSQRIMTISDTAEARRLIAERGIDVVVPCGFGAPADEESLVALLRRGVVPDWLVRRPLPGTDGGQAVYEVVSP